MPKWKSWKELGLKSRPDDIRLIHVFTFTHHLQRFWAGPSMTPWWSSAKFKKKKKKKKKITYNIGGYQHFLWGRSFILWSFIYYHKSFPVLYFMKLHTDLWSTLKKKKSAVIYTIQVSISLEVTLHLRPLRSTDRACVKPR